MGPIQVVVTDANNLVLEVTPTPSTTVILDRGIAGPVGPQGPGDVDGPASATDNAVARFDGTTGKLIQNSVVLVSDTGAVSGVTDLTASGAVTLSGGTANGVAYLNGSKVLTTGSALTFDGNTLTATNTSGNAITASRGSKNLGFNGNYAGANTHAVISTTTGMALAFMDESAEYMRLTSTGLGIGTATPAGKLDVAGTLFVSSADGNSGGILSTSGEAGAGNKLIINANRGSGETIFQVNSAEQMRLTSTGLGIGTSSPSYPLHVNATGNGTKARFTNGTTTLDLYCGGTEVYTGTAGSSTSWAYATANTYIAGYVNGSERLRLDQSGNLGLGVTPSAWGSVIRALQVNNTGMSLFTYTASGTVDQYAFLGNNSFQNSGYAETYVRTNPAAQYRQLNATHAWFNAPSGTAGDPITFTQAMTLSAAGDLGVGVTSPGARVDADGNIRTIGTTQNRSFVATNNAGTFEMAQRADISVSVLSSTATPIVINAGGANYLGFGTNATERARITSGGDLLVGGTSSVIGKLEVSVTDTSATADGINIRGTQNSAYGGYLSWSDTWIGDAYRGKIAAVLGYRVAGGTGSLRFFTASGGALNEVGRFDQNGNLLVGTTSNADGNRLNVVGGSIGVTASGASFNLLNLKDSVDQSGATFIQFANSAGTNIGNINRVGTTNAVVYNTTSDYRLKTVVGSVTGQGSRIDALKPIDYLWTEGGQQARGFLAHEFQTVYPNSVSGDKDAVDANGNPKYQAMQAATSEVIADLVAEIQSLRQRLAAAGI